MKISRTVGYAVQATLQLAETHDQHPIPCSHLAARGHMPERFLLQILRNLVTHGVLQSTRGVDGGYALSRAPEEISLLEVIEAIDGPLVASMPPSEGLPDGVQERLLRHFDEVTETARAHLASVSLSDIMARVPQPAHQV